MATLQKPTSGNVYTEEQIGIFLFTISVSQVYNTVKVALNKNYCIDAKMIIILSDVTMQFLRKTMLLRDSRSSMCHFKAINNGSHSQLEGKR